jgi:hypothetical protein
MSTRVTINGKPWRTDDAPMRVLHKPAPDEDALCRAVVDVGRSCRQPCFFVITGRSPEGEPSGYWRHAPGTFWTSR